MTTHDQSYQPFLAASLGTALILSSAAPVSALDIQLDERGTARFYQEQVLGQNSQGAQAGQAAAPQAQPLKTLPSYEQKEIQVRNINQGVEVELKEKTATGQDESQANFTQSEKMTDDNLKLEFSAAGGNQGNQGGRAATDSTQNQQQLKSLEQIRQERQERQEEMVKVQSRVENQERILELESRNVKAALQAGAEFKLDPETNQISIVTPSGQEHVLNHLPDQAVEQLSEIGLNPAQELALTTNNQGEVVYQTQANQRRRLFGLFPRQVALDVKLNDVTGQVEADLAASGSYFDQVLDMLSF